MTAMRRTLATVAAVALAVTAAALPGSAATGPTPGTASQIALAVAASPKINVLTPSMLTELESAPADLPWRVYGTTGANGCVTITACVYANVNSTKTIVLFGDSHAMVWLPAVVPWAKANGYRVVLLWQRGCPVAQLPTGFSFNGTADTGALTNAQCTSWTTSMISAITTLAPSLVLLGERTSYVVSMPSRNPFSEAQWQSALAATISQLQTPATKVAVIEDVPWHDTEVPECLAAYLTHAQKCSVRYPSPTHPGQQVAEKAAATATGAGFVNTVKWLCTANGATCSGVIGSFITYRDNGHVTTTYAIYLSKVVGQAIAGFL
jgi:hypothetical protein